MRRLCAAEAALDRGNHRVAHHLSRDAAIGDGRPGDISRSQAPMTRRTRTTPDCGRGFPDDRNQWQFERSTITCRRMLRQRHSRRRGPFPRSTTLERKIPARQAMNETLVLGCIAFSRLWSKLGAVQAINKGRPDHVRTSLDSVVNLFNNRNLIQTELRQFVHKYPNFAIGSFFDNSNYKLSLQNSETNVEHRT